jgi:tRNA threonylcarbamoyladenosine biosynthesis protein TsaB
MIILTLRTDKPEAEIGLYDDAQQIDYYTWEAHRQLAETVHSKILNLLEDNSKQWSDIQAIVFYEGPGSFTGLRIGASVANALAGSLSIQIEATTGDNWIKAGVKKLLAGKSDHFVAPEYGQTANITKPRK